jgi:eukaryotic-like serine/threonine-protein kinase
VYCAVDERLDCEVAIKVLAENHALDPDMRERFVGEAQLLRRAASKEMIAVHDIGETDRSQPYLVLEYADRGDLRRRVEERRSQGVAIGIDDIALVADMLRGALHAIHAVGVVHRDVKPENILIISTGGRGSEGSLLSDGERLVAGDLGYAKDLLASSGLTVGGGTVGFRAPEQDRIGVVDQRADIYAASAVLHWMATGTAPGVAANEGAPVVELPDRTRAAIRRGLAQMPEDRFSSIGEWHDAIGLPARAETPTEPLRRRSRRRSLVVAAAVLFSAIGGGWWAMSADEPTRVELGDGSVRLERQVDGVVLSIEGPTVLTLGEVALFRAAAGGAADLRWVAPNGGFHDGAGPLEVMAVVVGEGTVSLVGTTPGGEAVDLSFRFEVVD